MSRKNPFPARPTPEHPEIKLRYIAKGTFKDGSAYVRFPQEGSSRHVLFLLYPDGSAGVAYQGERAKFYLADSFDARLVKGMHALVEKGEVPKLEDRPQVP